MSFSSRRRNYLLTPHRRDGLIEWMKSMLQHSFVLDALETTGGDTFSHFEMLVEEHRELEEIYFGGSNNAHGSPGLVGGSTSRHTRSNSVKGSVMQISRLRQLVPTIGSFHTPLPLREAFELYNEKHKLTKRRHIQISFNEIRHILNLAQIIALRRSHDSDDAEVDNINRKAFSLQNSMSGLGSYDLGEGEEQNNQQLKGPRLITFDGDQTLYSDGANFESNPHLANYLYQLLRHKVSVAVVTAAGYGYNVEKYEYRLSGLLHYFKRRGLTELECASFFLFGGECNFLCQLGSDYKLHPVRENGAGGWYTATQYLPESPANWPDYRVQAMLDVAESTMQSTLDELALRGRVIRKTRSVGLAPILGREITRESLDEVVLRVHEEMHKMNNGIGPGLPYCAFNGGSDAWLDVGNKRVGVQILQAYLGIPMAESLHIGDQFLNTGNDYAARDVSPCVWIINPQETTYVLKSILRLADVDISIPELPPEELDGEEIARQNPSAPAMERASSNIDFSEIERRRQSVKVMDVYTGELVNKGND